MKVGRGEKMAAFSLSVGQLANRPLKGPKISGTLQKLLTFIFNKKYQIWTDLVQGVPNAWTQLECGEIWKIK